MCVEFRSEESKSAEVAQLGDDCSQAFVIGWAEHAVSPVNLQVIEGRSAG